MTKTLSELEDYVEHENVKRNATITKITRTIGKIIILFTIGPIFLCLSISMIIEIISTIQGTNEGGVTHMASVLLSGVIIIIIFLILSFHNKFKPGNPIPLGVWRKGSFFYKKIKKSLIFLLSPEKSSILNMMQRAYVRLHQTRTGFPVRR